MIKSCLKEEDFGSKQRPIEVEGKVLVGSFKEPATILGQAKEEGAGTPWVVEDIQGLFHPFERQSPSNLGDLFLPAFTPILSPLIRELRATDSFSRFFIGLALAAVPKKSLFYFQRLRNTLAEKRRQEGKGTSTHGVPGFAEIALYPNYQLPTPSTIKAMSNDLIGSAAVRAGLFAGKVVIFSPLSIILDRDAKACPELDSGSYTIILVWKRPLKALCVGLAHIIPSILQGLFCLLGMSQINLAIFYITRLDDCE